MPAGGAMTGGVNVATDESSGPTTIDDCGSTYATCAGAAAGDGFGAGTVVSAAHEAVCPPVLTRYVPVAMYATSHVYVFVAVPFCEPVTPWACSCNAVPCRTA